MVHKMVPRGPQSSQVRHFEGFFTTKGAQCGGKWCIRWCQMVKNRHMSCILKAFSPQLLQSVGKMFHAGKEIICVGIAPSEMRLPSDLLVAGSSPIGVNS